MVQKATARIREGMLILRSRIRKFAQETNHMKAEWATLAFCAGMVFWSCTPSPAFTVYFNPRPGAVYHCQVSERTHMFSTEAGVKVQRDHNVSLSYHAA